MGDSLRLDKQHSIQDLALRLASFKYGPFGRRIYKSSPKSSYRKVSNALYLVNCSEIFRCTTCRSPSSYLTKINSTFPLLVSSCNTQRAASRSLSFRQL